MANHSPPNSFPLIFIILIPFPFTAPGVFSTSLPEFARVFRSTNIQSTLLDRASSFDHVTLVSVLLQVVRIDASKFVGIAENERELQVPAASVSREWSCSSSTMVDGALDAPNDLFFVQNEMESGYTAVK